MRVGLLVNDHVAEQFRDIAGDYPDMFSRLLADDDIDLVVYDVINGELPTDPAECDAWVATGSQFSVNDHEQWIRDLEDFVRRIPEAGSAYVGICFGHQMLAKALGGTVEKSERGWGVGVHRVEVADGVGLGSEYRVISSHQDQIVTPPPGAEILGWSEHCPVSMLAVGDRIVGIQGHPEFVPDYSEALMHHRRGTVIPEETVDAGLASLVDEPDGERLRAWILDFLRKAAD